MANLLNIANQQQTPIDEDKLRILCSEQNVWHHFGLDREVFSALSDAKQLQMVTSITYQTFPNLVLLMSIQALEALFETHRE